MRDEIRRNMPLFPMGIVTKLTELTPRQVRYYEQQGLIRPARTKGNQRLFSFNDVDRLLQIKSLMEKGVNVAGVKEVLLKQETGSTQLSKEKRHHDITDAELRKLLKRQLSELRPGQAHLIQGELSRFFH
ncbi:MerR family transcriptional regulator [Polycladomyces subterraneus]|uniref:MerR family transcriptional regulator n=1 Tax=Polycladomyces subterraneus TaxID=1016997 RepID=A0ABT8IM47_9BACL|nr:MerR family transcriptional regulator [Polycladomyces subterraneus]MDN4593853.1 MerR family transcriptional regulator [Polycladomyces subterraneus]